MLSALFTKCVSLPLLFIEYYSRFLPKCFSRILRSTLNFSSASRYGLPLLIYNTLVSFRLMARVGKIRRNRGVGFRRFLVFPFSLVLFLLTPFSSQVKPTSQYVWCVRSEQLSNHLSMLELTNQPLSREIMPFVPSNPVIR